MVRDMRGMRGKVLWVSAGWLGRHLGKTVRLCRQKGSLPRVSLDYHGKQSVARLCRRERLISPLFYQDAQICNFRAPLNCLGER
jgi:hypothetical protein